MQTTIAEIMSKKIETVEEFASVQEVAIKMKDKNISSLIVVDSFGKSKGLVTERDLARKVCINDLPTNRVSNKEIMSSPLITIDSESSATTATDLMLKNNVRHLLVIDNESKDNNQPIGIITPLDLVRYEEFTRDEGRKDALEMILEYYI